MRYPIVFIILLFWAHLSDAIFPAHRRVLSLRLQRQHHAARRRRQRGGGGGTLLTFRDPSTDPFWLSRWYPTDADFNHATAGMTNPMIQIRVDEQTVLKVASTKTKEHKPIKQNGKHHWWPSAMLEDECDEENTTSASSSGWRVLRYRQRVGFGRDCYESLKTKCLDWEFQSPDGQRGVVAVPPPSSSYHNQQQQGQLSPFRRVRYGLGYDVVHSNVPNDGPDFHRRPHNALGVWSQGGRALATYTSAQLLRLGSRSLQLRVLNPVRVVYECVDQTQQRQQQQYDDDDNDDERSLTNSRHGKTSLAASKEAAAPVISSTLYTSSAYATLRGHWLKGEERVTVAWRREKNDGGAVDVEILSCSKPSGWIGTLVWPVVGPLQAKFFTSQMEYFQREGKQMMKTKGMGVPTR